MMSRAPSEGVRRLSLVVGIVAGIVTAIAYLKGVSTRWEELQAARQVYIEKGIPLPPVTPPRVEIIVLVVVTVVAGLTAWGVVRLVGWIVAGFVIDRRPGGPPRGTV